MEHDPNHTLPTKNIFSQSRQSWLHEHNQVMTQGRRLGAVSQRRKKKRSMDQNLTSCPSYYRSLPLQNNLTNKTYTTDDVSSTATTRNLLISEGDDQQPYHLADHPYSRPRSSSASSYLAFITHPPEFLSPPHALQPHGHHGSQSPRMNNHTPEIIVQFQVNFHTHYGDALHLVGNDLKLGMWNPFNAPEMKWTAGDDWVITLLIPETIVSSLEYKYVLSNEEGLPIRWEGGDNHKLCNTIVNNLNSEQNYSLRILMRHFQVDQWQE